MSAVPDIGAMKVTLGLEVNPSKLPPRDSHIYLAATPFEAGTDRTTLCPGPTGESGVNRISSTPAKRAIATTDAGITLKNCLLSTVDLLITICRGLT
jgi:hypothetical protein